LVGLVVVGGGVVVAAGTLLITRGLLDRTTVVENEVVGQTYSVVGVLYAVLLSFIVFAVWQGFDQTRTAVTTEAADTVAAYRDTESFPEPERGQAQTALRGYVDTVLTREWATHIGAGAHRNADALNDVWAVYRQLQPTASWEEAQDRDSLERLHGLE